MHIAQAGSVMRHLLARAAIMLGCLCARPTSPRDEPQCMAETARGRASTGDRVADDRPRVPGFAAVPQ